MGHPPTKRPFWRLHSAPLILAAALGTLFGLGVFTFAYAEGHSYVSDNPETCVNCHVMREQFDAWNRSSHKEVATCNDCHTPHRFPDKWLVKALNGWNHSVAFTTGNFADPIQIKDFNADVVQANCVHCHSMVVSQIISAPSHQDELRCVTCHGKVGHES